MSAFGMWQCVDLALTVVSVEHIVLIFRVEKSASGEEASAGLQPPADVGSPLANFSTLKMEPIRSCETSVNARSTQRHIPEEDILHSHRCENLKSYFFSYPSQEGRSDSDLQALIQAQKTRWMLCVFQR
jgi:hypothetical protein